MLSTRLKSRLNCEITHLQAAKTAVRARRVDPAKSSEAAKKLNSKAREIKDVADGLYKNSKANKKAALKLNKNLRKHSSGKGANKNKYLLFPDLFKICANEFFVQDINLY